MSHAGNRAGQVRLADVLELRDIDRPHPGDSEVLVYVQANNRSDDIASVAYWYQTEPLTPFTESPDVAGRLPNKYP